MQKTTRRSFMKWAALGVTSLVTLNPLKAWAKKCGDIPAAKAKKALKPNSSTAKRTKFVMVAEEAKEKKYKAGQNCGNCKHWKHKKKAGDWAACPMVANKWVPSCGWCKLYAKKS